MKKIFSIMMCAIMALSMISCGSRTKSVETTTTDVETVDSLTVSDTTTTDVVAE